MSIRKREWTSGEQIRTAWVVDYKDQHGARRLKTFPTQKAAKAWYERECAPAVHAGTHTPDSASITFAKAAKQWVEHAEREGRERSTVKQYRLHARHLAEVLGETKLSKLNRPRVVAVRDELLKRHSRATARMLMTSLTSIVNHAMDRGQAAQNAARGVGVERTREEGRKLEVGVDVPTMGEVQAILAHAKPRWRPLLLVATFTGMRASEVRGLRWQDVDFAKGVIHVRQRADAWGTIGPPKSFAGYRTIPMTPMVMNTLTEWRERCPKNALGLVFPSAWGNVVNHPNVWARGLKPAQEAAGVVDEHGKAKYGMHSLRHWFASWCIAPREQGGLGYTPKRAQTVLGHASIKMTLDRYGHLFPDEGNDREAMAAAERMVLCDKDATKTA